MSEENVEIVRRSTQALNRRDLSAWLLSISPDVVWESLPLPGFRQVYRGRAGAREWLEQLLEVFEGETTAIEITAPSDDRVLFGHVNSGRGRGSGAPVEDEVWSIYWLAEGLITRRQAFWTREEALDAAGLGE